METSIKKHRLNGWQAETLLSLFDYKMLEITTVKGSNGKISTSATARCYNPDGSRVFRYPGDFIKTIRVSDTKSTATEKAITTFHKESLETLEAIKLEAMTFYNK